MEIIQTFVESWDRQCACLNSVAELITEENKHVTPSADGWPLYHQLAHVHLVRLEWFKKASNNPDLDIKHFFREEGDRWVPSDDLPVLKAALIHLGEVISAWLPGALAEGKPSGGYDHPAFFMQHQIWHEGWHIGLILLALRLNGEEPAEEWEEAKLWGRWRVE
ncbi:MAG: DinB family protein [Chlorobia bacterium]|nr:DinB family protein [Fimbriimonadaceae bacterium]